MKMQLYKNVNAFKNDIIPFIARLEIMVEKR